MSDKCKVLHMIAKLNIPVTHRKCLYTLIEDFIKIVSLGKRFKPFSPIVAMLKKSSIC